MPARVQIQVTPTKRNPQIKHVVITGQIDESNLVQVQDHLNPLLKEKDLKGLIFNFKGLEFINSRVIGYLLSVYSDLSEREKVMSIVESNEHIYEILSLVGLTTLVNHYDSFEEALEVLES